MVIGSKTITILVPKDKQMIIDNKTGILIGITVIEQNNIVTLVLRKVKSNECT